MNVRAKTPLERMAAQPFPSDELLRDMQPTGLPAWLRDERTPLSAPPHRWGAGAVTRRRVLVAAGLTAVAAVGSVVVLLTEARRDLGSTTR